MGSEVVHDCYARCQHLIDGLERSNWQLREALTAESEQRVRDHEQYVDSLAAVTDAVKGLQGAQILENQETRDQLKNGTEQRVGDNKVLRTQSQARDGQDLSQSLGDQGVRDCQKSKSRQNPKCRLESLVLQALQGNRLPKTVLEELTSALGAAGDSMGAHFKGTNRTAADKDEDSRTQSGMALVDRGELSRTVKAAEGIIKALQQRLEKGPKKFKTKKSKRFLEKKSSRSSTSSYHTPQSSTSFKSRKYHRSFGSFFSNVQRQNKKLKIKYQHVFEKFKESLDLCGKLQDDIVCLTANRKPTAKHLVDGSTQTDKTVSSMLIGGEGVEKPHQSSRNVHILQGRLDAAAKVMAKQCKQIQDLQQQLTASCDTVLCLKKRLSRAESAVAGKEALGETSRRQLQDLETKNSSLILEVQQFKTAIDQLKLELTSQTESCKNLELEKESALQKFEELNRCMETKLNSLSSTLQQKEEMSARATGELQIKLSGLRERLVSQTTEARDRLVDADSKIQELYLGIETFLRLLFSLSRRTSMPELSASSQAHAVQIASDILQLPPGQVQTILHSSRTDNHLIIKWVKDCNRLVHNKVFAKNLGHFLLDAVLDAKIS